MSKVLGNYLKKIDQGKPINLRLFLDIVEKEGLTREDVLSGVGREFTGKNDEYLITSITSHIKEVLDKLAFYGDENRVKASLQNKSHSEKVSGSLIVYRQGIAHPEVAILHESMPNVLSLSGNVKLLIIENLELFLSIESTQRFLELKCNYEIDDSIDVVYASGDQVTNKLNAPFINQYREISYFVDMDVGGLDIAKSIFSMASNTVKHAFLLPSDIESRLASICIETSQDNIEAAYKNSLEISFLDLPRALIQKHRKFLEQESFIYDISE